jgi:hypothetical protein
VIVSVPLTGEGDAALAAAGTISAAAMMPITIASLRMIFSFEVPRRHLGEDLRGGAVCETSGALNLVVPGGPTADILQGSLGLLSSRCAVSSASAGESRPMAKTALRVHSLTARRSSTIELQGRSRITLFAQPGNKPPATRWREIYLSGHDT